MISSSPDRNTFQLENYVKRQEEAGKLPSPEYLDMFKTWREQDQAGQLEPRARVGQLGRVPPPRRSRPDDVRPDDRRVMDLHRHPRHRAGHL